jgi:hypothetical protein
MSDQDTATQQSQQSGDDWFKQNAPGAVSPTDPGNLLPVAPTPAPASGPHAGAKHPAQQPAPTATAASTPASAGANPDDWFKQNAPQTASTSATPTMPTSMFPGASPSGNMYPGAPLEATAHKDISGESVMNDLARGGNSFAAHDIPNPFAIVHDAVSHPGKAVAGIAASTPPGQAFEGIKNSVAGYEAYEKARSSGAGVIDSLKAASDTMKSRDAVAQQVQQRADEFKKDPGAANARALFDVLGLLVTTGVGAGTGPSAGVSGLKTAAAETTIAAEPAIAAEAGAEAAAPKTGLITNVKNVAKQVAQGEKIAQPQAQEALRTGVRAGSTEAGVTAVQPPSLRAIVEEPIHSLDASAKAAYRQIDAAAGTDFKALNEKLSNTEYQIRQLTDTEEDVAKEAALEKARTATMDKIEAAKQQAIDNGVDPKLLDKADAQFKQARALEELEAKVFKNPNVVAGNAVRGTPETINVDSAVKALQRLQDKEEFGGSRLEQALGKKGADDLLNDMYAAQRAGTKALTRQQFAVKLAKYGLPAAATIGGAAYELAK